MTRKRILLAAAMMAMLLTTSAAFALLHETDINYYFDDCFVTWVGEYDVDCDGNVYDTGGYSSASYRVYDTYSCSTGLRTIHRCQETDGMGGWITVTCPANQP
jgi:hypothetical protein